METVAISRNELKKIIRETFVDVLSDRKDLISDAVLEAIEDIGLAKAMEKGRTGKFEGYNSFYRIKFGDYRLGTEVTQDVILGIMVKKCC